MAKRKLTVVIAGDASGLDKALGQASGAVGKFGKAIGTVGVAGAAGLAAVGVSAVSTAAGFQDQMREVFTLLPGAGQEAFDSLTDGVKSFAGEFGVLPQEVVPALYDSLSAGVPPGNVFDFLEVAQKAAKGGVTDLGTAVDGLTSVVNAYGTDVITAGEASDLMFTAVRLGKTTMGELSSSMSNVTPIAASLGVGFEDLTAGIAVLTSKGVETSVATTQMRAAFTELSKSGTNVSGIFQQLTGQTFQEFIAAGGNTAEAFGLLSDHSDQTGIAITDMFGSVEAASAVMSLGADSAGEYSGVLGEMQNSAGATDEAFGMMNQGLSATLDRLKAKFQVALIEVGEKVLPVVEQVVLYFENHVVPAVQHVADVFGEDGLSGVFALLAEKIGEAWPGIRDKLLELGANLLAWLGEQVPILAEKLVEWGKAFVEWLAPNIPPMIEELAKLLARVTEWIVVEALPVIGEKLLEWGKAFVQWALPIWVELQVEMLKLLGELGAWIVTSAVPQIVEKLLTWATEFAKWVPKAIVKMVAELPKIVSRLLGWGSNEGSAAATSAGDSLVTALWNAFKKVVGKVVEVIAGLPAAIGGAVLGILGAVFGFGSALATTFKNGAIAAIAGLADILLAPLNAAMALADSVFSRSQAAQGLAQRAIDTYNSIPKQSGKPAPLSGTSRFTYHSGGTFRAPVPGGEGYALLRDGERIVSPNAQAGAGDTRVIVQLDSKVIVDALAKYDRMHGTAIVTAGA